MRSGAIAFTRLERVHFGRPAAEAVAAEAELAGAARVFVLASRTLARETDAVERLVRVLGGRLAGLWDDMPPHSPREAVVGCARAARAAGCDMLVTFGGGSATDAGKAVVLCLKHGIETPEGLEPFRTVVDPATGRRHRPDYAGPDVPLVCVPTTLSGGEFNPRAGITDTAKRQKQSFMHPGLIPRAVVLDPDASRHTPEWLFLSTGVRAVDHAVETFCSLDANDYTDGTALQALRLLAEGLPRVKRDPADLEARLKCQVGAWTSMAGIVTGTRLGASHAIGHILGGTANVPHGHTSCVMLPAVLAWNAPVNAERQRALSAALGEAERPAADLLDRFVAGLGMPRTLREVGITEDRLPHLAEMCLFDDWTFSNPRPIRSAEAVMEILRAAF